jgi:hypothetical protein
MIWRKKLSDDLSVRTVAHAESSFRHGIGSYGPIETVTGSVGR